MSYRVIAAAIVTIACRTIPPSIQTYASALPGRADGQYALLDDPIKKQLVTLDAMLQCDVDVFNKKHEANSAACKCAKSSSSDWIADCRGWLGAHTPPEPSEKSKGH